MVTAIEQGIILESTKARLSELEQRKSEIEVTILQEQIKKPFLTKEQIRFGIDKFKSLDYSTKEGKQCLTDSFINAIYLYDDKITFIFNYKDGTQTVSLAEFEATCGSDIKLLGAPAKIPEKFGCFFISFLQARRRESKTRWRGSYGTRYPYAQTAP